LRRNCKNLASGSPAKKETAPDPLKNRDRKSGEENAGTNGPAWLRAQACERFRDRRCAGVTPVKNESFYCLSGYGIRLQTDRAA
jgi:hypothetical protein